MGFFIRFDGWLIKSVFQPIVDRFPKSTPAYTSSFALGACIASAAGFVAYAGIKEIPELVRFVLATLLFAALVPAYFLALNDELIPGSTPLFRGWRVVTIPWAFFTSSVMALDMILGNLESGYLFFPGVVFSFAAALYLQSCDMPRSRRQPQQRKGPDEIPHSL